MTNEKNPDAGGPDGPRRAARGRGLSPRASGLGPSTQVMEAEVGEIAGAGKGEISPEGRGAWRNGYRRRDWDTRVGTIPLNIPKLREGTYFPSFLEPRRTSERAFAATVQEAYVNGVSTTYRDTISSRDLSGRETCPFQGFQRTEYMFSVVDN